MGIVSKIADLPKPVIAMLSALGTAALGLLTWIGADYNTFRTSQNEINKQVLEQSIAADAKLDPFIVKFKNLVIGKASVTEKDREEFGEALRFSQNRASDLKNRYPSLQASFDDYTASLVGLKQSLAHLNGPLDGKKYILALSRYFVAQAKWREEVTRAQASYWRSFALR